MKIYQLLLCLCLVSTVYSQSNIVSTFAGSSGGSYLDGTGTNAKFTYPRSIVVDPSGNLFVTDHGNDRIRKVTPAGVVTTFAGGSLSNGGIDGTGTNARFSNPQGIAMDSDGNLYVADSSYYRIRKITTSGVVTTLAGSAAGYKDAVGTNAQFASPYGVAVDSSGNVYVGDMTNHKIRKITSDGTVTTLAGSSQGYRDATGTNAQFSNPYGIAVDLNGNVYVADYDNDRIRKITSSGVVTTYAGGATAAYLDGIGTNALFKSPRAVSVDASGNVYVGDTYNHKIRKIDTNRVVTTIAGSSLGLVDAVGTYAKFNYPKGIGIALSGNLYIADNTNHRIRKIGNLTENTAVFPDNPVTTPASANTITTSIATTPAPFVCPGNAVCDTGASTFSCFAGYTYNSTINQCSSCPLGQFKSTTGNTECYPCPIGQESDQNRTGCITCSNGFYRSSTGSSTCLPCPNNSECTASQFTCNIGYAQNIQSTGCDLCLVGTESNQNRTNCVSCSNGYYRPSTDYPTCINCPGNAVCSTMSFTCNSGYRINSTNTGCDQCPVGTESSVNKTECIACKSGFYRPSLSTSSCIKCPDFSNCSTTSFTCLAGYQLNSNGNGCSACPSGYVKSNDGDGNCTKCDIGLEPNANRTVCSLCQNGYFKPTAQHLVCVKCPQGAICSPQNLTCLAGYTVNTNQSYSCVHCQEDYFKQQEGNHACDLCALGYYSSDDYTTCFKCPAGYFSNTTTSCTRCGAGKQPIFNRTFCIDCPSGSFKPNDLYNLCLNCPDNAVCNSTSFTCNPAFQSSGMQCVSLPVELPYYTTTSDHAIIMSTVETSSSNSVSTEFATRQTTIGVIETSNPSLVHYSTIETTELSKTSTESVIIVEISAGSSTAPIIINDPLTTASHDISTDSYSDNGQHTNDLFTDNGNTAASDTSETHLTSDIKKEFTDLTINFAITSSPVVEDRSSSLNKNEVEISVSNFYTFGIFYVYFIPALSSFIVSIMVGRYCFCQKRKAKVVPLKIVE